MRIERMEAGDHLMVRVGGGYVSHYTTEPGWLVTMPGNGRAAFLPCSVVERLRGMVGREAIEGEYGLPVLSFIREFAGTGLVGGVGVAAREGKVPRAGPVRALYLQGMVHHVAGLGALERQQREWDPSGPKRPRQDDRIDALVHGAVYLADLNTAQRKPPPRGSFSIPGMM